jgi:uncharacterized integral membrane protein
MSKIKALWLLVVGALLAIFTVQNWYYPNPPIHFLGVRFLPLPQPVIIMGFALLGFVAGWVACALRAKKRQDAPPPEEPQAK